MQRVSKRMPRLRRKPRQQPTTRSANPTVQRQARKTIFNAEKTLTRNALRCERLNVGKRSVERVFRKRLELHRCDPA